MKEEATEVMSEEEFESELETLDSRSEIYHPDGPGTLDTL